MAMSPYNAYAAMQEHAFSVQVKFFRNQDEQSAKVYTYLCDDPELKVGDYAIVMAPDFSSGGGDYRIPKTVLVVSKDDGIDVDLMGETQYGWIVQRVDLSPHHERNEKIKELANAMKAKRNAMVRKQIQAAIMEEYGLSLGTEASTETNKGDGL